MIGIYKITNLQDTNKIYIGRSLDIKHRWESHISELNNGKHINKDLQIDWDEYGADNFKFEVIDECSSNKESKFRELQEIDKYRKLGYKLYNTPSAKDDIVWYICDKLDKLDDIIDFEIDYIDDRCKGKKAALHWPIGIHIKNDDYVFVHLYNMNTYELYNDLEKLQYNLSQRKLFVDEYGYYIINKDISNVKDDNQEDFADQLLREIITLPLKGDHIQVVKFPD